MHLFSYQIFKRVFLPENGMLKKKSSQIFCSKHCYSYHTKWLISFTNIPFLKKNPSKICFSCPSIISLQNHRKKPRKICIQCQQLATHKKAFPFANGTLNVCNKPFRSYKLFAFNELFPSELFPNAFDSKTFKYSPFHDFMMRTLNQILYLNSN